MKNLSNSKIWKYSIAIGICAAIFASITNAQIATGGNYTLTQTAIANGGASGNNASVSGNYSLEGTIGQNAARTNQQTAPYTFQPGFWTAQTFAPTAASVTVSGRVVTASGGGIRNVRVTLTGASGAARTAISTTFGYFRFEDVAAGETYIFSVFAKRYTFSQPVQVRWILEDTDEIIFTANPEEISIRGL